MGTKIAVDDTAFHIANHVFVVNSRFSFLSFLIGPLNTSAERWSLILSRNLSDCSIPYCFSSRKCREIEIPHQIQSLWSKNFLELFKEGFGHSLILFRWSVTQSYPNGILTQLFDPGTQALTSGHRPSQTKAPYIKTVPQYREKGTLLFHVSPEEHVVIRAYPITSELFQWCCRFVSTQSSTSSCFFPRLCALVYLYTKISFSQ